MITLTPFGVVALVVILVYAYRRANRPPETRDARIRRLNAQERERKTHFARLVAEAEDARQAKKKEKVDPGDLARGILLSPDTPRDVRDAVVRQRMAEERARKEK